MPIEQEPLHRRLSEEFRHRIQSGEWAEGSPVPSEAALCSEFGTSRGPVRQALATLRAEGVVFGGRGRPPVVSAGVPSQPFTTFLSFTQWALSLGKVPGQRTLEVARRPAGPVAATALGLSVGDPVVEILRVRLLDEEPTMVERSVFILEVGRHLFDFDPDAGSIFGHLLDVGIDLHRARHTIDALAANADDARVLGIEPGAPLLRERRVTADGSGHPLEYADDRYRPELSSFTIENILERPTPLARVSPLLA